MRISGSIPFHVARAYGASAPSRPCEPTRPVAPTRAPTGNETTDDPPAQIPARLASLVGGRVRGGLDFASASTPSSPGGRTAFPLYTRAADRIEAAVGIALGRSIDVKG